MSGKCFVAANEELGARWPFSAEQVSRAATEIQPDAEPAGPFAPNGTIEIMLPGQQGREHTVTYHGDHPVFVFREEDGIEVTAGFVLRLLQRLAPAVPAAWFADFEGDLHPLRVEGTSVEDFVRQIWGEF